MKCVSLFAAILLLPLSAIAQVVPSPSAVTAFNNAVAQFDTDYGLYGSELTIVGTDQAAVTATTNTLNTDTATLNTTAGSISTDLANIQTAFAALTPSQQAAARAKLPLLATKPVCDQDDVDLTQAVIGGCGGRLAAGPYHFVTMAFRQYLADHAAKNPNAMATFQTAIGRTPNPARACKIATIAVVMLPIINSFQPIPDYATILAELEQLQAAACGTVPPTPAPVPVPTTFPANPSTGPPQPHKAVRALRPTGARPTPRDQLIRAPKFKATGPIPANFSYVPPTLSMWGNSTYGDCVSAEEAFAKAAYSVMMLGNTGELFVPESTLISWASSHGYLNGANLTDVMATMASVGLIVSGTNYCDGGYSAIDWTDSASLCNALTHGPVKLGVAAGQEQSSVGSTNGWFGLNWKPDSNEDHCNGCCGYGSLAYCCSTLGVTPPAGQDLNQLCYFVFTWDTVGIVNQASLNAICSEAWLRNPTTVVGTGPVNPPPTPPTPPTPTRRAMKLLQTATAMAAAAAEEYPTASPARQKQILAALDKAEQSLAPVQAALAK
jgi:hypothetical protein